MNEIIFYRTPDGDKKIEVLFQDKNFWLTQKALAGLFDVKVPAVSKHLRNIFVSGELVADSVISILETTAADDKIYKTKYYNLDAIIAVGYRVNSYQATQFRIWATKTLKEFIIKGFVLLLLDRRNAVSDMIDIDYGTVDRANPYIRDIIQTAIRYNAPSIIVAHNHPSGAVTPSNDDKAFTKSLMMAARATGISFFDHIIIGGNRYFSFADEGLIGEYKAVAIREL